MRIGFNHLLKPLVSSCCFLILLGLISSSAFGQNSENATTITIGMNELLSSMDPPKDWIVESTWVHMNIFDCLVWRNRETAEFEPWLAGSWENVNDTTWRMRLKEGITFHNGESFDADAVVWTYGRILEASRAEFLVYNQWQFIDEINVLGPYEVEFVTVAPEPAFLSKMAGTGCGIQAPIAGREMADSGEYIPIGTGPFKFVEFILDDHVTLEANEEYWRGAPGIDRLIWRSVPEASTRVANLLAGAIDLIVGVPSQDWDRINNNEGTEVETYPSTRVMLLSLRAGPSEQNPEFSGPTENPLVREAIRYAIDRELIHSIMGGSGVPLLARTTPPTMGWSDEFYNTYGDYDPERAMQLLEEAGYDGEPLTFHATTVFPFEKNVAETITAMLQAVGLNVELAVLAPTPFREQIDIPYRNEEIILKFLGNSFFDPWIEVLAERSNRRERSGWSGPEADRADELIRAAEVNMDPVSRAEQYREINRLFYEEVVTIPLFQLDSSLAKTEALNWDPPRDGFLWMGNATVE